MAYINKEVSTMAMPSGMNRMGQFPLDMSSVYYDLKSLQDYATSGSVAYVGQILSLVNETDNTVTLYAIKNKAGDLATIAADIVIPEVEIPEYLGDNKSIEINDSLTVSIHDFGKVFYKYIPKEEKENGEIIEAHYEKTTVSESEPWKAGLEPRVVSEGDELVLGWFEPNPTTIEGINNQITALQEAVEGLEQKKDKDTTYSLSGSGVTVTLTPSEGEADSVTLDAYTKKEIDDKFAALPEDKDTTYSVAEGEKVLKLEGTAFSTVLKLDYSDTKIKLLGKDDVLVSEIDASAFVADGVLNDVDYDAENDKLIFTWNIIEGTNEDGSFKYKTVEVDVKDLVDTYTAGNGLDLTGNAFSVKLAEGNESFLSVDANGVKLSGVQTAINTAKQEAIDAAAEAAKKYDSKAEASAVYTKEETNNLLNAKANSADVYTKTEADGLLNAKANSADVYTKTEADSLLDAKADKTTVEATYATKEALKATDDVAKDAQSRVDIVEGKIDEITSVGGEPNVVEKIKVNGVTLEVEKDAEGKSTKSVNIEVPTKVSDLEDDKTYDSRINAAQSKAEEGVTKAGAAQAAAEAAQNKADVADGKADKNAEDIKALQEADTTVNGKIQALENTVNNTTSGVAANYAAVVKNAGDISTLSATVGTHTTDIADLKTATGNNATEIAGLKSAVGNVYTKTEAEGKFVEKEDGKSLISTAEIERLSKVNNYDDTSIKALIQGNTDAITNITKADGAIATAVAAEAAIARAAEKANADAIAAIYKVDGETKSGVLATEIARVEGLVATEKSRAEGVEADHEERIAEMENFWKAADDPEGTIDKLAEIVSYIEKDKTGAIDMAADIQENTEAIAAINDEKTGILVRAKEYTDTEIAKLTDGTTGILAQAKAHSDANLVTAKGYSDANLATAKGYSDTNLAAAKKYSDDAIAALLVKNVDNTTLQLDENGVASVKAVSTDLLTQGSNELIFCAGNASGYITK